MIEYSLFTEAVSDHPQAAAAAEKLRAQAKTHSATATRERGKALSDLGTGDREGSEFHKAIADHNSAIEDSHRRIARMLDSVTSKGHF